MAEEVGFEPTKGYKPLPVFKTGAFNRSATLPDSQWLSKRLLEEARILRDFVKYSMTNSDYFSINFNFSESLDKLPCSVARQ